MLFLSPEPLMSLFLYCIAAVEVIAVACQYAYVHSLRYVQTAQDLTLIKEYCQLYRWNYWVV